MPATAVAHRWLEHEEYAECRVLGRHAFRRRRGRDFELDGREVHTEYLCSSCGTILHVWWDVWTGKRTSAWYDHPDDYLVEVGPGQKRPLPSELRARYFRQHFRNRRRRA